MAESDLLVADEEVIAHHNSHERRKEHGERTEHCDKCGGFVDKLPRLDNPGGSKCDYRSPADVDISREDASQINSSSNGITTNILEEDSEGEGQSQEEDSSSRSRRSISICVCC